MPSTEHHDQTLRRLGSELKAGLLDLRAFRREVTVLLRERFQCDQVVLWRVDGGAADARDLHCVAERRGDQLVLEPGHRVPERELGSYLDQLLRAGVFTAAEGEAGAQAQRLHPAGARNPLHASATYNGRFLGIVCCNRCDAERAWTPAEQLELRRLAVRIALSVGALAEGVPATEPQELQS